MKYCQRCFETSPCHRCLNALTHSPDGWIGSCITIAVLGLWLFVLPVIF